jgi:hypothetical protein
MVTLNAQATDTKETLRAVGELADRDPTLAPLADTGWTTDDQLTVADGTRAAAIRRLAEKDPLSLLRLARMNCESAVQSFTTTLVKQERDEKGRLGKEETLSCKFLREPRGVFLQWQAGADRVDRALYAPILTGADVLVHPTGFAGALAKSVRLSPTGEYADSVRQITSFGLAGVYDALITRCTDAQTRGDLTTMYLGETTFEGQAAMAFQWMLPAGHGYPCGRIVLYLCRDTLLPLTISTWNWSEELQSRYVYRDLQTNVSVDAADFSLKACGLE